MMRGRRLGKSGGVIRWNHIEDSSGRERRRWPRIVRRSEWQMSDKVKNRQFAVLPTRICYTFESRET